MAWNQFARGHGKKIGPETIVTRQLRELLRIMHIPHTKNWAGPLSEVGVSDIFGTLPGVQNPEPQGIIEAMAVAARVDGRRPESAEDAIMVLARRVVQLEARGRAFYCEVKAGKGKPNDEQLEFLERHRSAGAVAFVAWNQYDLLQNLIAAGFEPAKRIDMQLGGHKPEENGGKADA